MSRQRTPDQPPAEPETPAATATTEPPSPGITEPIQSFTARIEQERRRKPAPDPFAIAADYVAGVRLFESRRDRQMAIKFDEKPGQPVIDKLKEAGYRWNPADRIWAHPVRPESARTTRIEAEALYQEVRGMIRQEKGIESSPEIPF